MELTAQDVKRVVWTFVQAAVGSFLVAVAGIAASPSFSAAKALAIAASTGGIAAGWSAVKNLILTDTSTLK